MKKIYLILLATSACGPSAPSSVGISVVDHPDALTTSADRLFTATLMRGESIPFASLAFTADVSGGRTFQMTFLQSDTNNNQSWDVGESCVVSEPVELFNPTHRGMTIPVGVSKTQESGTTFLVGRSTWMPDPAP